MDCPNIFELADRLSSEANNSAFSEHLHTCPACAARVSALRETLQVELPTITAPLSANLHLGSFPDASPTVGDIWLTAEDFRWENKHYHNLDQLMFVVLDENVCEHGRRWLDVAPLSTNVELATDFDLVFQPQHSTLGMDLACLPRHQLFLAWEQFDSKIGEVVDEAFEVLTQSLSGRVPAEWAGSAYDSAFDPRLEAEKVFAQVVEQLREPYLTSIEEVAAVVLAPEARELRKQVSLIIPLLFDFKGRRSMALAAQGRAASEALFIYDNDHLFEAKLSIDVFSDKLLVEVERLQEQWIDSICLMVSFKGAEVVGTKVREGLLEFGPANARGVREIANLWLESSQSC